MRLVCQRPAGAHSLYHLPDRRTGGLGVTLPIHKRLGRCARDFLVDAVGRQRSKLGLQVLPDAICLRIELA